ncbi:hypothetical protein GH714_034273 [Hevea brasiliensis]|uniref:Disease resistance protein At4g27190-like leucine-rich repeats domain-containing protein n=1 Tax=Hevea brasiliensis TaxID=3981 RepID=A0A6A6M5A4_HEVBR|nr:hypothetical protein GH714_034273 [Hevea brasiliensis]
MGHKIKQIREKLDEIASHKAKFHLNEQDEGRRVMPRERAMTYSFVNVSDVIGRDEDKEIIIRLLQSSSDGRQISIISIVRIGDMSGLKHLRTLIIANCESLISLPQSMKYLTALEILHIEDCENLNWMMEEGKADQDLSRFSLQRLILKKLPELVEFQNGFFEDPPTLCNS